MSKLVSLRLDEELAGWAEEYAKSRGVSRSALLEEGLRSFKRDCESGVPEIREAVARQSYSRAKHDSQQGVGACPSRAPGLGHVWKSHRVDPFRSCEFCGLHGREPAGSGRNEGGGYFRAATGERAELFSHLAARMENGTGRP